MGLFICDESHKKSVTLVSSHYRSVSMTSSFPKTLFLAAATLLLGAVHASAQLN